MIKISLIQNILIIIAIIIQYSFAQPNYNWQNVIGGTAADYLNSVIQTQDNNYIAVGSTYSYGMGSGDIWLLKFDQNGDTLWTKTYGTSEREFGRSLLETFNGNFILFNEKRLVGNKAIWLIKTTPVGDTLWTKTIDMGMDIYPSSFLQTQDGGFILICVYMDNWNSCIIKTDSLGDTLWTKTIQQCNLYSIQTDSSNNYLIAGSRNYFFDDSSSVYLLKIDLTGNTLWEKRLNRSAFDRATCMRRTDDGNFIVAATTDYVDYFEYSNIWLLNINTAGDTLWTKTIDIGYGDGALRIIESHDGGFILLGLAAGMYGNGGSRFISKINSIGDTIWTDLFSNKSGTDILKINHSEYIIIGNDFTNNDGWFGLFNDISTGLNKNDYKTTTNFKLYQNYPNPFNPSTTIKYVLPKPSKVKIEIFNTLGQKIETIINKHMSAGSHKSEFSARNLSSGIYYYKIQAGKFQEVKKMVFFR